MKFIYDSRKRTIREINKEHPTQDITLGKIESRLLETLFDRHPNTWADILKYVYGPKCKDRDFNNIHQLKYRLLKKTNLNIDSLFGYGLILKDSVYVR